MLEISLMLAVWSVASVCLYKQYLGK